MRKIPRPRGATRSAAVHHERVLNHRDSSVGGIYDRYSYTTERKEAVMKLGLHVESLTTTNRLLPARLRAVEVA